MEEEESGKTHRVSVRIPKKQWVRMCQYGEVLGLDTDSAILKHFLNLGLQAGGASLAAQLSNDAQQKMLAAFEKMVADSENAEQLDLVKEASKATQ